MKIIISHDTDFISVTEHYKDLIIPKFILRSFIEFSMGYLSVHEIKGQICDVFHNKWQNLDELMDFDAQHKIPSTFFIGVAKGKGLCYSLEDATRYIRRVLTRGFDIGVHGISFNNYADMEKEYELFQTITNLQKFGMRIHYLRSDNNTFNNLDKIGYLFDCSLYDIKNPFRIGKMWEFPLHMMDSYLFFQNSKWRNQKLPQVREASERLIENGLKKSLKYFTILFHDANFCKGFQEIKEWYMWLVTWLIQNGFEFISYKKGVEELENNR